MKEIWKKTKLIDLPYKPFASSDGTERSILNHITNGIIKISKNETRKNGQIKINKDYNFNKSDCIIGIDISNISDSEVSYLDSLSLVTDLYPFVLVNCNISNDKLKRSPLHRMLKDRGYILPTFKQIPANDILYSASRYGEEFSRLICGEVNEIVVDNLNKFEVKLLKDRFHGLDVSENKVFYTPEIYWIGVDNINIAKILNYLFNNNIFRFSLSEICREFAVKKAEILPYLEKSMLFFSVDDDCFGFRFLRRHVLTDLMRSLVSQFETQMIFRNAIDTSHSDFFSFRDFSEYHSIGKLFEVKDTFSLKILSYVRHLFDECYFDDVIVIDNGKEDSLVELIPKIFPAVSVKRILNYYGDPTYFPFNDIEAGRKVIVIIDIINTGEFILKTLKMLETNNNVVVQGLFSFILNTKIDVSKFYANRTGDDNFKFCYFIDKELKNVDKIREEEQTIHFKNYDCWAYMRFWDFINKNGSLQNGKFLKGMRVFSENMQNVKTFQLHRVELDKKIQFSKFNGEHFVYYITRIIKMSGCTAVVIHDEQTSNFITELITSINNGIEVFRVGKDDLELSGLLRHKSILIFIPAVNVGMTLFEMSNKVRQNVNNGSVISSLCLFSRNNVVKNTTYLSEQYKRRAENDNIKHYCYYDSHLPYYLCSEDSSEERQLNNIFSIME